MFRCARRGTKQSNCNDRYLMPALKVVMRGVDNEDKAPPRPEIAKRRPNGTA